MFESIKFDQGTVFWLINSGAKFDVDKGKLESIPICTGYATTYVCGKVNPTRVTIYDEQVSLLFRLKYTEAIVTAIHIFDEKICYDL
jgi:hypothetical protein